MKPRIEPITAQIPNCSVPSAPTMIGVTTRPETIVTA